MRVTCNLSFIGLKLPLVFTGIPLCIQEAYPLSENSSDVASSAQHVLVILPRVWTCGSKIRLLQALLLLLLLLLSFMPEMSAVLSQPAASAHLFSSSSCPLNRCKSV